MGRDNSPWERQRRHLERKTNNRASHDRILIVSEGKKPSRTIERHASVMRDPTPTCMNWSRCWLD